MNSVIPEQTKPSIFAGMRKLQFPLHQLGLKRLPGERWKDIEGYEGYFKISSHGRILSVERSVDTSSTYHSSPIRYTLPPRIRKQKVQLKLNSFVNKPTYECLISLRVDGQEKTHLVARLVYHHFVRRINFKKDGLMITHKKGDGRNNFYKNLEAVTRSVLTRRAYGLGRQVSPMLFKSKKQLKRIRSKAAQARWKPVQRTSASGHTLKNYDSIKEASAMTGIPAPNIIAVLKGRKDVTHGTYWRYQSY